MTKVLSGFPRSIDACTGVIPVRTSVVLRSTSLFNYVLNFWGGVRQSSFVTSATTWPIIPAQDDGTVDGDGWDWKPKYSQKTCPSASLSTTNLNMTWQIRAGTTVLY
jgi:hypothetical protein